MKTQVMRRAVVDVARRMIRFEPLEARRLFSVFFDYDVVAQSGGEFTGFGTGPSINDEGEVAFVGKQSVGDSIYVDASSTTTPIEISPSLGGESSRTFGQTVQINNFGKVVSQQRLTGPTVRTFINLWEGLTGLDSQQQLASGDGGGATGDFLGVFPFATVNDGERVVFGALSDTEGRVLATPGNVFGFNTQSILGVLQPMISDAGNIVVRAGGTANSPIVVYDSALNVISTIASSSGGWTQLGAAPSISDDGDVVVFSGDRGNGPGIFASVNFAGSYTAPIKLAGENTGPGGPNFELGRNEANSSLHFASFSMDSRIGVIHEDRGTVGLVDDTLVVSYLATPNATSILNPQTGDPLLFTDQLGLWTQHIELEVALSNPANLILVLNSAQPVAQVGDLIGGQLVTGLAVNDPIALANVGLDGVTRTPEEHEHLVAFHATTDVGQMIVRAAQLDTDQDGLLDHWERNGIDIDSDGVVDLDLAAMGADYLARDLFMEIDWTVPRPSGGTVPWSNELPPGTTQKLVDMFAAAPAPVGSTLPAGIRFHLDAGAGDDAAGNPFSANMGAGPLDGGSLIAMPDGSHPDVVYFGDAGAQEFPGVKALSFARAKADHFGVANRAARELAFHYTILCDFYEIFDRGGQVSGPVAAGYSDAFEITFAPAGNIVGHSVMITSGTGAGQVRHISSENVVGGNHIYYVEPWATVPDASSTFVAIDGSSGLAEVSFIPSPNNNGYPGNDQIVSLGNFGTSNGRLGNQHLMWRTLAHELGHTLGLRHGGTDHLQFKGPAYKSLMSYSWQFDDSNAVNSYTDDTDPTFDDWSNIRLDMHSVFRHLGNTFGNAAGGLVAHVEAEPAFTPELVAQMNGEPLDLQSPALNLAEPAVGASVDVGGSLTASFTASDTAGVGLAKFLFDLNGDGDTNDAGEDIIATNTSGTYSATFNNLTGPGGTRVLRAFADDIFGNFTTVDRAITIGGAPPADPTNQSPAATDDVAATTSATAIAINVLGNDTDSDGTLNPASVTIVSTPANGAATVDATTGVVTYTSSPGFSGEDVFTYTVKDNLGATSGVATARITVTGRLEVIRFFLVNASTDQDVMELTENSMVNLANFGKQKLTIRAQTGTIAAGSVRFGFDATPRKFKAKFATDNSAPFGLFGGGDTNFTGKDIKKGSHRITATPFTLAKAKGDAGQALTVRFKVIDAPVITRFQLIDAQRDVPLFDLTDGMTISLASLSTTQFNVRAFASKKAKSVAFDLDGASRFNVESDSIYALFKNKKKDFNAGTFAIGTHTLSANAFSKTKGKGSTGGAETVTFTITA